MNIFLNFLNSYSYISTIVVIISGIIALIMFINGIAFALFRLGNGLAKRKIAIFADSNKVNSLKQLILKTKLFRKKNIFGITTKGDFKTAEKASMYLVVWDDWKEKEDVDKMIKQKKGDTAFIIYAPPDSISKEKMVKFNEEPNVIVVNFRGRLLNDIVISMITTPPH